MIKFDVEILNNKLKKLTKETVGFFLYLLYSLLNIRFFNKKKRIVFISFPDAADNSWHLYKYALENLKDYEFVWLINSKSDNVLHKISSSAKQFNQSVTIEKRWSFKGLILFSSSQLVFFTHGTYFFIRKAFNAPTIVNLWHGMPIKAIGLLDEGKTGTDICYSDYLIATSDFYREIMAQAFNMPLESVLITGLPRNDVLYSGITDIQRNNIYSTLQITTQNDIIVWLPTYRVSNIGDIRSDGKNTCFIDDLGNNFLSELNQTCLDNNITTIVKLHPMDASSERLKALNFSNILFFNSTNWSKLNIDLYELISISKGIISDFSSVMIDCLPTNIPVGYIDSGRSNYKRNIVIPLDILEECITKISEASDIIKMISFDSCVDKEKINYFNSSNSNSSKKILNTILTNSNS